MLCVIAVVSDNAVIGRDNDLPWRLSADLKRFKALTTGHTIVMGRRTWESIGRPLPQRRSIVVTRRPDYAADGARVAHSLDEAVAMASDDDRVFVIGGAALFRAALPRADRLYLTRVHAQVEGDVLFPDWDERDWRKVEDERHAPDERNEHAYSFRVYDRTGYNPSESPGD